MSAEQWEALDRGATGSVRYYASLVGVGATVCSYAALALFARLMAVVTRPILCRHGCGKPALWQDVKTPACEAFVYTGSCADELSNEDYPGCLVPIEDRARYDREVAILGSPSDKLMKALRSLWAGTDRGEAKALLCEVWGASPAIRSGEEIIATLDAKVADIVQRGASDLRGLAERESQDPSGRYL